MGMKLKSGADLCGFQLTNFCVQGEASAPSDAALGRKYFHTNATDDVATGISLLNRERIYLGEGAWRATAYLDDIAAINEKLNLITGDTDTDTLINNLKDLEEFLKDFSETDKLKSLLNGKLNKSGGTITGVLTINTPSDRSLVFDEPTGEKYHIISFAANGQEYANLAASYIGKENALLFNDYIIIHSGNIGSYNAGGIVSLGYPTTDTFADYITKYAKGASVVINDSGADVGNITKYESVLNVGTGAGRFGRFIFSVGTNPTLCFQTGNDSGNGWGNKKTIAFTDSNVASANLLTPTNHGGVIVYNNSWANRVLLRSSWASDIGDYIEFGVPSGTANTASMILTQAGNVLIGATEDNKTGAKLQVNGSASFIDTSNVYERGTKNRLTCYVYQGIGRIYALNDDTSAFSEMWIGNNSNGIINIKQAGVKIYGNLHVTGNIIADKEVSAGGAGAEEGTSGGGSAEGVSEIFTPTSTSMAFDHNLGEDVIVQVYEKSGNVWNMVMVDTEITSATRVTLRFGKTETTQHKVVIMGV